MSALQKSAEGTLGVRAVGGSNPLAPKFKKARDFYPGLFEFMEEDERFEGSICR